MRTVLSFALGLSLVTGAACGGRADGNAAPPSPGATQQGMPGSSRDAAAEVGTSSPLEPDAATTSALSSCNVNQGATTAAQNGVTLCEPITSQATSGVLAAPYQGFFVGDDDLNAFDPATSDPTKILRPAGWTYPLEVSGSPACLIATYRSGDSWTAGEASDANQDHWKAVLGTRAQLAQSQGRSLCDLVVVNTSKAVTFVGFVRDDGALMLASIDDGFGKFTPGVPAEASAVFAKLK